MLRTVFEVELRFWTRELRYRIERLCAAQEKMLEEIRNIEDRADESRRRIAQAFKMRKRDEND